MCYTSYKNKYWKCFCELLFQKHEIQILQLLSRLRFAGGKECEKSRCKNSK